MKAALYCRLSEEDKNKSQKTDDSESIRNQKTMLTEYAKEHGWEIYDLYSDDDYAGADRERPAFNRLLKDAQAHRFDIVLCKTQSRFTREMELVEKYLHGLFPLWGIRFVSIVDHADTENQGNKKTRQINGLVNEWYLEDMSENIKSVLKNKRKNGFHIGSFALYGYEKDPSQKGHLIVDKEAAAVVREVFIKFSQGYGKTAIARMLNEKGIPNPTEYKRRKGLRYQAPTTKAATLWKYPAIASMLKNEIYIGNMVQGKYGSISYRTKKNKPRPQSEWYVVKGTHEAIIEPALWETVQGKLCERTKPFANGTIGLFANKVRCAACGYGMRSSKSSAKKGSKSYLQCATRHAASDACEGAFIAVDRLEALIVNEINSLSEKILDKKELEEMIDCFAHQKSQKKRLQASLSAIRQSIEAYTKAYRELYMDKVKGLIRENDFIKLSETFSAQIEKEKRTEAEESQKLLEIEAELTASVSPHDQIEAYTSLTRLNREIVETLIDYIEIGKRIPGSRNVPIKIHWNF